MNLRALRDKLPRSVAEVAHDSVWTLAFEAMAIVTVTASFLMLGKELAPDGYGQYVGLFAILTPISAVGSAAALATLQACFQEQRPVDRVLSTFLAIVAIGGLIATGLAALITPLILDQMPMTAIVSIALSELVLTPMVRVVAGGVRSLKGVPAAVRVELSMLVLRFIVLVTLFVGGALTVSRLGIGWLTSSTTVVIWLFVVVVPGLGVRLRPSKVALRDIKMVGALGAPIYISEFQTNGDKAVLAGTDGLEAEAGLYGAAFKLATLAITPLRAMDVAVFHRFLESDDNQLGLHVRRARVYTMWSLLVVAPIALGLLVAAPILTFLVGDKFEGSVTMTRWLVLWLPFRVISLPPLAGLLGLGRLGMRLAVLIASASISMVLYLILIPRMGWEGAVIGTVAGEICLSAFGWAALLRAQRERDAELAVDNREELALS